MWFAIINSYSYLWFILHDNERRTLFPEKVSHLYLKRNYSLHKMVQRYRRFNAMIPYGVGSIPFKYCASEMLKSIWIP